MALRTWLQTKYPFAKSWRWIFVFLFDVLISPFALFPRKKFPAAVKTILVIRLDQIGDVLTMTPVLHSLADRFPQAKIVVLTDALGKEVLRHNPYVHEVISFQRNWFSRKQKWNCPCATLKQKLNFNRSARTVMPSDKYVHNSLIGGHGWKEWIRILKQLRQYRFDLGYDLRGDLRNILLMCLAGVHYRLGYGIAGGSALLDHEEMYDIFLHQVQLNMQLVEWRIRLLQIQSLRTDLFIPDEEIKSFCQKLESFHLTPKDQVVVVHPEAGYASKTWDMKHFQELLKQILTHTRMKIAIAGTGQAKQLADAMKAESRVMDLVNQLSLRELMVLIKRSAVFIGHDSGPSHLAQALHIPAVILASGTNRYELWGLWQQPLQVLQHHVTCAPCYLDKCPVPGHPCMDGITPEMVFQGFLEMVDPS